MVHKNRRRKFILHGLQVRLIIIMTILTVGISAILVISLYLITSHNLLVLPIPEVQARQVLSDSIWPVIMIAIVLFVINTWTIVIITHRVYGPLYRLTEYIKKLVRGEKTNTIKFRKDDAVHGLQEVYNDLRDTLGKTLHYNYQEMITIFYELENILDKMYNKKIHDRELYNTLQEVCHKIAKALDITSEAIDTDT
jgi:uncharacterized membrane protein YccC